MNLNGLRVMESFCPVELIICPKTPPTLGKYRWTSLRLPYDFPTTSLRLPYDFPTFWQPRTTHRWHWPPFDESEALPHPPTPPPPHPPPLTSNFPAFCIFQPQETRPGFGHRDLASHSKSDEPSRSPLLSCPKDPEMRPLLNMDQTWETKRSKGRLRASELIMLKGMPGSITGRDASSCLPVTLDRSSPHLWHATEFGASVFRLH